VMLDSPLAEARQKMDADRIDFAVVLDDDGGLHGYLGRRRADGDGVVRDRARRLDAWVQTGSSLKAAFSEMLLHDAGWIAVLDKDTSRYLGVLTPESLHTALRHSVEAGQAVPVAADERDG